MKIGIAITTTPKRFEMFQKTYSEICRFAPENSYIFVYNDKDYKGVSFAKNKCIEALMAENCDYLFLFDDDCYPVKEGWNDIFINSGLHHSALTFTKLLNGRPNGNAIRKKEKGNDWFMNPCGIMLFYTRECINRVGGMDSRYSKWGHEHVGHSRRIYNAGLIPYPFICPNGAMDYFWALDQQAFFQGNYTPAEQQKFAKEGIPIMSEEKSSTDWKPYTKQDYCLGTFFTKNIDVQRRKMMKPDISALQVWKDSLENIGLIGVIFNDCFKNQSTEYLKFVNTICPRNIDLYNYRYVIYEKWIKQNYDYIENIYLTDVTDVEFYQYPQIEKGFLYIGSEEETCDLNWLKGVYSKFIKKKDYPIETLRGRTLLNCGIIYGHKDDILLLLSNMNTILHGEPFADMYALNWIGHNILNKKVITGYPIHTKFRKNETKESGAYIRHK